MPDRRSRLAARASRLAVLAKAPIPGYAKTRLIPRLGPEGAAALQALLVKRTLQTALAARLLEVTLWCAPSRAEPSFGACGIPRTVLLRDQPAGDLGARMCSAIEPLLARGAPVLLVGTDCPSLTPEDLLAASAALHGGADAVLLPAEDGGYGLIGLRRMDRRLFSDVPWSTSRVLAETRTRLRLLGWRWEELPSTRDVDLPEDLDWLLAGRLLDAEARALLLHYS